MVRLLSGIIEAQAVNRREFIKIATLAAGAAGYAATQGYLQPRSAVLASELPPNQQFDAYFLKLLGGFLTNARRTSPDYVVCDYPGGTKLKSCCTPSYKSYVSVARIIPAMAEWIAARGPTVPGSDVNLIDVLVSIYRNAFNPKHPDFWGLARSDKATQLSVEAALIASTLCRVGDPLLSKLTSADRANIQTWLASCTQVPERVTNHAWFSAINQGARLELSRIYPEFKGDEKWMLDDLTALDGLFPANNDGWYSDDPTIPIYDYYNFWVFANFPIFWSRIIGKRYPEWTTKFHGRIKTFLENTPYFFSASGLHPLFGRSLIYRWALLSPMLLGYEQGFWPHSPGLLRRIVRKSLEAHFAMGAFDETLGKLRETYTPDGTVDVKEAYVDNGHPYWAMQVFTMFAIPPGDPFWSAPEELLPIEKADYTIRFPGPRMLVVGNKDSGQVKWMQARNIAKKPYYRDKYDKFVYSSHFPFNVVIIDKRPAGLADQAIPIDQTLVFCSKDGLNTAGRTGVKDGSLLDDGIETKWWSQLGNLRFQITVSRIRICCRMILNIMGTRSPRPMPKQSSRGFGSSRDPIHWV